MATGYSLDALVKEHYKAPSNSLGSESIDGMYGRDNVGTYSQGSTLNASVANGYPSGAQAGNLEVILTNANSTGNSIQRYTNFANLRVWIRSQASGGGDRTWTAWVEQVNMSMIYNAMYPVGIVVQFDNATNPNNAFTGTVWEQITDGRAARAATSATAGTSDGQIGSVAGSDSVSIAVDNLPSHTHNMRSHTHSIGSHTHTMAHTHSINHDHGAVNTNSTGAHTHTVSGSTNNTGAHTHTVGGVYGGDSIGGKQRVQRDGNNQVSSSAGAHSHTISGTAESAGAHTHSVDLPNFTGTSGGSSAANTGGTALTTGGPSNNTSDATGGGSNLNVRNSSHYYAFWKRVA